MRPLDCCLLLWASKAERYMIILYLHTNRLYAKDAHRSRETRGLFFSISISFSLSLSLSLFVALISFATAVYDERGYLVIRITRGIL